VPFIFQDLNCEVFIMTRRRMKKERKIAVVGLGKLGAPLAALWAVAGWEVYGVEQNRARLEDLSQDKPRWEPLLEAALRDGREQLHLTGDYHEAVANSSLACVVVPTPSDSANPRFSLDHVRAAVEQIVRAVTAARLPEYTIDIVSTLMPGDCENTIWPLIQRLAGRSKSRIELVYSPTFIALGQIVQGLATPDFLLVGGPDAIANGRTAELHGSLTIGNVHVVSTSWINAEIAKLAINCLLGVKISWANLLATICERLPGADVDAVTRLAGLDTRIGPKCLAGGLGFGGPCLPRDIRALADLAERFAIDSALPDSIIAWNDHQPSRVVDLISTYLPVGKTVGFLGVTYREDAAVTEASQPLAIAQALSEMGHPVIVYEPFADALASVDGAFEVVATPTECVERADCVVLATRCNVCTQVRPASWKKRTRLVVDCWRQLPATLVKKCSFTHLALGRSLPRRPRRNGNGLAAAANLAMAGSSDDGR
jgi:UDPglucose 6-dehydrogenase